MDATEEQQGGGVRVAIGSGVAVFLIAAVFWAGATYNRVQGIETQLGAIQAQISKFGDFQATEQRVNDQQRRLDKLEDQMRLVR